MAENTIDIPGASQDLQTIEDFVNLPADSEVYPRLLPSVNVGTLAGTRQAIFEAGGLPAKPFATKALMTASALVDGDYAQVTDDTVNNGLYVKTSGSWVKSTYDPLAQAKAYTELEINSFASSFLSASNNKFNSASATKGSFISSSGTVLENPLYSVSDYIRVLGGNTYTMSSTSDTKPAFSTVNYFDAEKLFLSRTVVDDTAGAKTFTTPPNAEYIRLNIYDGAATDNNRMLNEGITALPYEPYKEPEIKINLTDDVTKDITDQIIVTDTAKPYIKKGVNLFDANAATLGYVITATGDIEANEAYAISDFIEVEALEQYTISHFLLQAGNRAFTSTAYYSKDKVFIERIVTDSSATGKLTITIPKNVYFVRFNITQGLPTQYERMFSKGSVAPPYVPYVAPTLSGLTLGADLLAQVGSIDGVDSAREYIVKSNNLYDYSTVTDNKYIDASGVIVDNTQSIYYGLSDYIAVEPNEEYTISGGAVGADAFSQASFFTANKVFISRLTTQNRTPETKILTITTPPNAYFVRFNINAGAPNEHKRMFNKGAVALPYEDYKQSLSGLTLAPDILHQINSELEIDADDRFMVDTPVNGTFSTTEVWAQYGGFRTITSAQVYAMYDNLLALYPDYISKQELGNDSIGNPIAAYKFKPQRQPTSIKTKFPKIFLVCGTHGYEHLPPLATYLMLEQMCSSWQSDSLLEGLRFNAEFIVIPVANPSGWNAFTRKNVNGVDINRSFPEGFGWQSTDPTSAYYGGATPLQELESQYIVQIFNENPDIDACYDFHNFSGTSAETHPHYLWVATGSGAYVQHMAEVLCNKLLRKWRKEYDFIPAAPSYELGRVNDTKGAMIQDHALARGIKFTGTFEIGEKWWIKSDAVIYDALHCKTAMEAFTNWMLINLHELTRR